MKPTPIPAALLTMSLLAAIPGRVAGQDADDQGHLAATPGMPEMNDHLDVEEAEIQVREELGVVVFEMEVEGEAGGIYPQARGQMQDAPVVCYAWPTTIPPSRVGFAAGSGVLTLVATSHPDWDDTPLWDENMDGNRDNDGRVYHAHWVVLERSPEAAGGWQIKELGEYEDPDEVLPPTHPDLPLYVDSPGYVVVLDGDDLRMPVPLRALKGRTDFEYDALVCYLELNVEDEDAPMLPVKKIYSVIDGELELSHEVDD